MPKKQYNMVLLLKSKLRTFKMPGNEQLRRKPADSGEQGCPLVDRGIYNGLWALPWADHGAHCPIYLFCLPHYLFLDPLGPWYWLWYVHVGCLWTSFTVFFDPQGLIIFILLTCFGLIRSKSINTLRQVKAKHKTRNKGIKHKLSILIP